MSKERRESRRAFYEKQEKDTFKMLRRLNQVSKLAHGWGAEKVKLEKPIRRGWIRFYRVRPDLQRSPQGPALAEVLNLVQCSATSLRKDFTHKVFRKKEYKPIEQHLRYLSEDEYNELPERLQKYFYKTIEPMRWGGDRVVYAVTSPWKFDFVVKKYYITELPMSSTEAESEYKKLSDKLFQGGLAMKLDHHSDPDNGRAYSRSEMKRETRKLLEENEES